MSKFFKSLAEVNAAQKFYRTLSMLCVAAGALSALGAMYFVSASMDRQRNTLYTLDRDGNVLSMRAVEAAGQRPVEATAHARLLLQLLFDIDRFTYKDKLVRAYDLGNNSIYAFYKEQEAGGWYADVEQYNARSALLINNIKCANDEAPYTVSADFSVIINSDITKDKKYNLSWQLDIIDGGGERTERNPHNLMVTRIRKLSFVETGGD